MATRTDEQDKKIKAITGGLELSSSTMNIPPDDPRIVHMWGDFIRTQGPKLRAVAAAAVPRIESGRLVLEFRAHNSALLVGDAPWMLVAAVRRYLGLAEVEMRYREKSPEGRCDGLLAPGTLTRH